MTKCPNVLLILKWLFISNKVSITFFKWNVDYYYPVNLLGEIWNDLPEILQCVSLFAYGTAV